MAPASPRCAEKEVVSLDQPLPGSNEEEEPVYEDVIEDRAAIAFAQQAEDRQRLAWVLERLDERSRRILEWRFGHGLMLDQIGTRENLSRERVRQIEREALDKLRR